MSVRPMGIALNRAAVLAEGALGRAAAAVEQDDFGREAGPPWVRCPLQDTYTAAGQRRCDSGSEQSVVGHRLTVQSARRLSLAQVHLATRAARSSSAE